MNAVGLSNPLNHTAQVNPFNCSAATNPGRVIQVFQPTHTGEQVQSKEKLQMLEARLKVVEGSNYDIGEAVDLCLVPDVVIPSKFKVPEFDKYRGTTCPKGHLTMYCRKMAAHARDDKLLIHCFQDSLTGPALSWYMHLGRANVHSWKNLADAFLKQYKYNIDMTPDRLELQNMSKKEGETFKEYAQRWREVAAQVEPPLSDKETVALFIDTLRAPFYDKMIGSTSTNFADIVIIGERVENGMRTGKIAHDSPASFKKSFSSTGKKKEAEANAVTYSSPRTPNFGPRFYTPNMAYSNIANISPSPYPQPFRPPSPASPTTSIMRPPQSNPPWNQSPNQMRMQNTQDRKPVQFDPIPMTYTELLPLLVQNSLVVPCPMKPIEPPYPRGYDVNARCDYHAGAIGHSTENCRALKFKVQDLIKAGWLNFKEDSPNVGNNPLPHHRGPTINAVGGCMEHHMRKKVEEVKTPLEDIFEEMCGFGMVKRSSSKNGRGWLHLSTGRAIENCDDFKQILQDLMDRQVVQIGCPGEDVATLDSASSFPKPLVVHYTKGTTTTTPSRPKPITIQVPKAFPYKDNKAVPWKYDAEVYVDNSEKEQSETGAPSVTNIAGIGGMTRSGRIYIPEGLRAEQSKETVKNREKGKEKAEQKDANEEITKGQEEQKKEVFDEEADEFLKFVKQSEYAVIDQLNRTPAKISLLSLMMNSEPHRKALLKILSEAHVVHNISEKKFEDIIGNITANNFLAFNDEEMPMEGAGHNKALHISVKCKDYILARVLVDNGSSLNVMPKTTLAKLSVDESYMKPSTMVVRAFDGSRREVIGEICLPIQIGPVIFEVAFHVMDIVPAYSCLLGRPWIHNARAVPSTLHQKLKFIIDDQLVIVSAEEDLLVSKPSSTPYIEAAEEALETSFQGLEIANATYMKEGEIITKSQPSSAAMMVAKVMIENGYQYGRGLGRNEQGLSQLPELVENKGRFGLGYKPSEEDKRKIAYKKREGRMARLENNELEAKGIPICDIRESFRSAGFEFPNSIAVVMQDIPEEEHVDLVRVCPSSIELNNWEVIELPVVFNAQLK